MPKSATNAQAKAAPKPPKPIIQDDRLAKRMAIVSTSPLPMRTIIKVEIGDTPSGQVQSAVQTVLAQHRNANPGHPIYICPVRRGVVMSGPIFEADVLKFVNELCHVVDGKIVFRNGPPVDVDVKTFSV